MPQKSFLKQINIIEDIVAPQPPANKRLSMAYKGVAQKKSLPYRLKVAGNTGTGNAMLSNSERKRVREAAETEVEDVRSSAKKRKHEKKEKKSKEKKSKKKKKSK